LLILVAPLAALIAARRAASVDPAAWLLPQILPVFSVVAPSHPGVTLRVAFFVEGS
jgi:hypothetical protein